MKHYPFLAVAVIAMYVVGVVALVGGVLFAAADEEIMYFFFGLALGVSVLVPADLLRLLIDIRLSTQMTADVQLTTYKEQIIKDTRKAVKPKKSLNLPRIDPNGKPKVRRPA